MARHKGSDSPLRRRFHVLTCRYLAAAIALPADSPRLLRARDGYLIYGPQELLGFPKRDASVDFGTGVWGIWMPGFCQFPPVPTSSSGSPSSAPSPPSRSLA